MTAASPTRNQDHVLKINYSGRIIDHLGLQMYQSPVAAVAELVANAWDADADSVKIELPPKLSDDAEIIVADDGNGMSFAECQDKFLNVGYARRGNTTNEKSPVKARRILGRKGIGKFAGFGIAQLIRIETVSRDSGERTVFEMDISRLRTDEYVNRNGTQIDLVKYEGPDPHRTKRHGTTVRLRSLLLTQRRDPTAFARSMARRFLLHQTAANFRVFVNDVPLPDADDLLRVQFSFPKDYLPDEKPDGLLIEKDWGIETVYGQEIRWCVRFYRDTIDDEEFRGVSVYAGVKLVQTPFFFNLSGGLSGQHGQQYISGQIRVDALDEQEEDLIAPERQRVNWDHSVAAPIQEWGQKRLRQLLRLWRDRRGEEREKQLQDKLSGFAARLGRLRKHEEETVSRAIRKIAQIETLSTSQFEEMGEAILMAWEQGRLHDLIGDISLVEELTATQLIELLAEAQVLTALNTAEAVKTKLLIVSGLKQRIDSREYENPVRDYISEHPWLVSPNWETFAKEKGVKRLLSDALSRSANAADIDFRGRVDLVLSSGDHLLILEFMKPGRSLDWDHIDRFERYVRNIRGILESNVGGRFRWATGYIIADKLHNRPDVASKIQSLAKEDMFAQDWPTLLANAIAQWQDFLEILAGRDPKDERLQALITE